MSALTMDRDTKERTGGMRSLLVAGGAKIYAGSLVALEDGYATPARGATGLVIQGRAEEMVDNSGGSDGDQRVTVKTGIFRFANSAAGDLITLAEIGYPCWCVDDQTVAKTSGSASRSIAGKVVDVEDLGVWVEVTPLPSAAAIGNLGDVADPAAARANIGANKAWLTLAVASLVGSGVYRLAAPVAGAISKIFSVTSAALADGDATLTASINGAPVTNGVITIAQAGSAAGDVDSATPTAARAVVAGDVIAVTVGGSNSAAATATITLEITY